MDGSIGDCRRIQLAGSGDRHNSFREQFGYWVVVVIKAKARASRVKCGRLAAISSGPNEPAAIQRRIAIAPSARMSLGRV
jgi:hypothetical protein